MSGLVQRLQDALQQTIPAAQTARTAEENFAGCAFGATNRGTAIDLVLSVLTSFKGVRVDRLGRGTKGQGEKHEAKGNHCDKMQNEGWCALVAKSRILFRNLALF
ncbi:uncharacterized protein QC761_0028480 [Podospora bellae-mahoneyi]|uniref:Uncharacterized protein n=1 Tax=Podospora bellae-mahoneyi TaxID=2093777 RepID=A0ABR0FV71_9PEZI|nr:hypothetical protein QC761_0028480 [Podospora bellae-mahoneyi]